MARDKKERLLANLLFEDGMRHYDLTSDCDGDFQRAVMPAKGWQHRESRQIEAMEYIYELSTGAKNLCRYGFDGVTPMQPTQSSVPCWTMRNDLMHA